MKLFFMAMLMVNCLGLVVMAQGKAGDKRERSRESYDYYYRQVKKLKNPNPHNIPGLDDYSAMQLCFWSKTPEAALYSNVFGVKLGLPLSTGYGRVFGWEASVMASSTDHVRGVQSALVNVSHFTGGMQVGVVNVSDRVQGVQLGLVNVSKSTGFQFGLINYIEGAWLPCWPICNVSF